MTATAVPERDFVIELADSRRIAVAEWGEPDSPTEPGEVVSGITDMHPHRATLVQCLGASDLEFREDGPSVRA